MLVQQLYKFLFKVGVIVAPKRKYTNTKAPLSSAFVMRSFPLSRAHL